MCGHGHERQCRNAGMRRNGIVFVCFTLHSHWIPLSLSRSLYLIRKGGGCNDAMNNPQMWRSWQTKKGIEKRRGMLKSESCTDARSTTNSLFSLKKQPRNRASPPINQANSKCTFMLIHSRLWFHFQERQGLSSNRHSFFKLVYHFVFHSNSSLLACQQLNGYNFIIMNTNEKY